MTDAGRASTFGPCGAHADGRHRFVDADRLPPNVTLLRVCSCGFSLGVSTAVHEPCPGDPGMPIRDLDLPCWIEGCEHVFHLTLLEEGIVRTQVSHAQVARHLLEAHDGAGLIRPGR